MVPHIRRVGEMQARCRRHALLAAFTPWVSPILPILGLLLMLASSEGGANQNERRSTTLLYGLPSDDLQSCFAPFLHRQVEYRLDADAAWGFGNHAIQHSTANVSAVVRVSTQLGSAGSQATVFWVHTLEVVRMWSTKSYADRGSPQTDTESMPLESPRFRVRIVQRECSTFSDIIHSPQVSAEELKFAQGLTSMILLSLPSAADVESKIHEEGPYGRRPALLSIRRVHPPSSLKRDDRRKTGQTHMYVTHVKRHVNETKAPIVLTDGTAVPLRDEISGLEATLDHDDIMVQTKTYSQVFVRPVIERDGDGLAGDEDNVDSDMQIHANGHATLTFMHNDEGRSTRTHFEPHLSETLTVPFSQYGAMLQQSAEEICSPESSQELANFVEPCVHRLAHCEEGKCIHDLVRLMKGRDDGQMAIIEKLLSETNAANVVGRDLKCRKPAPNILSALAVASSRPAQEILSNFIVRQTKIEQTGGSVAPCAIESLEVTHGVLNPSQQLFDTVYLMASQFGPPFKQTQFSSTAMLALGSLGRASIASREISPGHDTMAHDSLSKKASSLLQLKFREAVHLYAAHDYHYQKSRMQATQAFQRASLAMRNHFMASVRSLTSEEFLEEWAHADVQEREHWGNESLQYLIMQIAGGIKSAGENASSSSEATSGLRTILLAMGNLGSKCVVSHLEKGLLHRELTVVSAARRSLGEVKQPESEAVLLRHFHNISSVNTRARVQVLQALSKHHCSHQTASSILTDGLRMVGEASSRNNETCMNLCSMRCLIRSVAKCSNFCRHSCSNRMLFKSELAKFLYSIRNTGHVQNLVNDAVSAGLLEGLKNLGIFPGNTQPRILRIQHNPVHWEKNFGTDVVGANLNLHLENRIRIWISTFGRSMEAVVDNSFSASTHAWIFDFKILEAGIEFEAMFSSHSQQVTPPDLKTTLSEWGPQIPQQGTRILYVQALWRVLRHLDSLNHGNSLLALVDKYGSTGHKAVMDCCHASDSISRIFTESLEFESFESFDLSAARLREVSHFAVKDAGDVIRTMQSTSRLLTEDVRWALQNASMFSNSILNGFQNNIDNNTDHLAVKLSQIESTPLMKSVIQKMLTNLPFSSDLSTFETELSMLQTYRQRSKILVESRYWGASVQDSFLEPVVDDISVRHRKPSLLTGRCLTKWSIRSYRTLMRNHSSSLTKLSHDQCRSLGFTSHLQFRCCKQAVGCYASCHYSKSTCDSDFQNCAGPEEGIVKLRRYPPWHTFGAARHEFCLCQKGPVRPYKVSGECPPYFSKLSSHACTSSDSSDTAMDTDLAETQLSNSSRLTWVHAAARLIEHLNGQSGIASSPVSTQLSQFIELSSAVDSTSSSDSFVRWMNVSRSLFSSLKDTLFQGNFDDHLLLFCLSRIPRSSQDGIARRFEASMSLSLWDSEASNSIRLLQENLAVLQELQNGMKEATRGPEAGSMKNLRDLIARALEEEDVMFESASVIKRRFLDHAAAQDMQLRVRLSAIKHAGYKAKTQYAQLSDAWSRMKTSYLDEMLEIKTLLWQREEILRVLKTNISPEGKIYRSFQDISDLIARLNSGLYDLDLHNTFASYQGVVKNLCSDDGIDSLKDRSQAIPKVLDSILKLKEEISTLFEGNSSGLARDLLLLGSEPDVKELMSRSFAVSHNILNGLSPLCGPASSHLKSIAGLMQSAQDSVAGLHDLNLNLNLLHQSYDGVSAIEAHLQQILVATEGLIEKQFPTSHLNDMIHNLSQACELRHHVKSAENTFLEWKASQLSDDTIMQTVAQSLQTLQHNLNKITNLQATTASIVQLMQAPPVLLSHLESLVNMTDRVRTFETSLETLSAALSAVAPTSSLMQIDAEVKTVYRGLYAFYLESNTQDLWQSSSLERAMASLIERLSILEPSFSTGVRLSQAYAERIGPLLEVVSREATEITTFAVKSYEIAQKLSSDDSGSLTSLLATIHFGKDTLSAKKRILNSMHFVASDFYKSLNERVVIESIGNQLALISQAPRTVSFMNFAEALDQLPVENLRASWLEICAFAPQVVTNSTCMCIHDKRQYAYCSDRAPLREYMVKAYKVEVATNEESEDGQRLLVALDMLFLLTRSTHESDEETEIILAELSHVCQVAQSGTYDLKSLEEALAAVQSICQIVERDLKSEEAQHGVTYSGRGSFSELTQNVAAFGQGIREAIKDEPVKSISESIILTKEMLFLDTMLHNVVGTEAFAIALGSIEHSSLEASMQDLIVSERLIVEIARQNGTRLSCSQYPTFEMLRSVASRADQALKSVNESRSMLQHDLEILASGRSLEMYQELKPEDLPRSCSPTLCIQSQTRTAPGRGDRLSHKYQIFFELVSHAYDYKEGSALPSITAPGLYSQYSIRASTFLGSERILVTLEPVGLKKLQEQASLIVVLQTKGEAAGSIEKIFELFEDSAKFNPFLGSVDGITVANQLIWMCSTNQGKIHSVDVSDIMQALSEMGPSRLSLKHTLDLRGKGIRASSVFFDATTLRMWVAEYSLPSTSGPDATKPGLACGFQADSNGVIAGSFGKICIVIGEYVQGLALYQRMGRQMVAVSRCITQHAASPCKVEFHMLMCAATVNPSLECFPPDSHSGTLLWDITGPGNVLGNSLQAVVQVPPGARGLAFQNEDDFFGGYLLICFSSATEESFEVYSTLEDWEDSMYIFATPIIFDEPLHVKRNSLYITFMGKSILDRSIFSDSFLNVLRTSKIYYRVAPVWTGEGPIFSRGCEIFLYGPLSVGISISASWNARLDFESEVNFADFFLSAALQPSANVEIDVRGYVSLQVIRGGVGATATVLDSRFIPEVRLSLVPTLEQPVGIEMRTTLFVRPLAVEVYGYVEHPFCLDRCAGFPCGLKWCEIFRIPFAKWRMGLSEIQLPTIGVYFPDSSPPLPGSVRAYQTSISSLTIEWYGFSEPESEIFRYFVCVGSEDDESTFMPCTNVGIATSFQGHMRTPLGIPHGTKIIITVRCSNIDQKHSSASSVLLWDRAVPIQISVQGNLLQNFIQDGDLAPADFRDSPCTEYRPRIGLVHTCIMVNQNMVLFRLSLDESGTDSRVTSISFSIEDSLNRSTLLDYFQQQQIMFPDTPFVQNLSVYLPRVGTYVLRVRTYNSKGVLSEASSPPIHYISDGPKNPDGVISINSKIGMQYVRSPNLDASWTRFSDPNAGIYSYEYNIVTDDNKLLLPYQRSNGRWPAATASLSNEQMQHKLALAVQVRARNFASAVSEIIKSPVVFDLDPPQCRSMSELVNGSFDVDYIKDLSSLDSLHFRFNCWDSSPGMKAVKLCIGAFPYGCDVSVEARERMDSLPRLFPSLKWRPGIPYFLTIQVQDAAGWLKRQTSDGFTIDLSPPSCLGGVIDGNSWIDKDFQNQLLRLDANFESLMDAESPLQQILIAVFQEIHYEIFVDQSRRQISEWINAGDVTKASIFFSSPLEVGHKYFVIVKAKNAAGHVATCESNGVKIDTMPPSAGNVKIMHGSAQAVDVRTRYLLVSFDGFNDSESGIQVFVWRIDEIETASTVAAGKLSSQGSRQFFANVQLAAGRHYVAHMTARDWAGNEISSSSEAILTIPDDTYLPDAFRIFEAVPKAFKTSQDVAIYLSEVILPRLYSEALNDRELRWCLSKDRRQDNLKRWASLELYDSQHSRKTLVNMLILDSSFFFFGVEVTNAIGIRRSLWHEYTLDGESPACLSDTCLWILSPGGIAGVQYISSHSSVTCRWNKIYDNFGIDFFIAWPTCKMTPESDDHHYAAVQVDSYIEEYTFNALELRQESICFCNLIVYDIAGNSKEIMSGSVVVDQTRPSASVIGHKMWFSSISGPVLATISDSRDQESGNSNLRLSILKLNGELSSQSQVIVEKSISAGRVAIWSDRFEAGDFVFQICVRAENRAGLATTSLGDYFQFDPSPPIISSFRAGEIPAHSNTRYFQSYCHKIHVEFECSDPESGTGGSEPEVGIGVYEGDVTTVDWVKFKRGQVISSLNLEPGLSYFVTVRCHNEAGLTTVATPGAVICDLTPPNFNAVSDGTRGLYWDFDVWSNPNALAFSFHFDEFESVIISRYASLSTTHCDSASEPDTIPWNDLGYAQNGQIHWLYSPENLPARRYFVFVKAKNVLEMNSSVTCSDGFELILTSPTCTSVWNNREMTDIQYSNYKYATSASWNCTSAFAFESFEWQIIQLHPAGEEVKSSLRLSGKLKSATIAIELEHSGKYLSRITGSDQVGESQPKESAMFAVDVSPPVVEDLVIGFTNSIFRGEEISRSGLQRFTTNNTHVSFSFVSSDPESGVHKCRWKLIKYPSMSAVTNFADVSPLLTDNELKTFYVGQFPDGYYQVLVGCTNGAGSDTESHSPFFVVDTTEPFCGIPELKCKLPPAFDLQQSYPKKIQNASCTVTFLQQPRDEESGVITAQLSISISSKIEGGTWTESILPSFRLSFQDLTLYNGTEYAATATCTNRAGIVGKSDMSLPFLVILGDLVPGDVIDGFESEDIDFQTHSQSLIFKYDVFHDPMKHPLKYEWAAGTSKHTDDVVSWKSISSERNQIAHYFYGVELPLNRKIFVHVRASSGLRHANASSDGIIVVVTKPVVYHVGMDRSGRTQLPLICDWHLQEGAFPSEIFLKFGSWPGGDDLQPWTRADTDIQGVATINSLNKQRLAESRVWASIKIVNSQLALETLLMNHTVGLMFDTTAPKTPLALPYVLFVSKSSEDDVTAIWSPFPDDESKIREYQVCLDIMDPKSHTRLTEEACATVNSSVRSHSFTCNLNVTSIVMARVIAINEVNLSTFASSQPLMVDKTPPICNKEISAEDMYTLGSNSTSIDSTIFVMWDPCSDNESDVHYNIAIEAYDHPSEILDDRPLELMASRSNVKGHSYVLALGRVENGKRLRILVAAASSGGIQRMSASFIRIDYSPPVIGPIKLKTESPDPQYHTKLDFVSATWPPPFDNESSVVLCNFSIYSKHGPAVSHHVAAIPVDSREIASYGPWFEYHHLYRLVLTCSNEKGLISEAVSPPFIVPSPPTVGPILHGELCSIFPFVRETSHIQACWPEVEAGGAEIESILWCLGSAPGLQDILSFQTAPTHMYASAFIESGSQLAEYYVTVLAISTAGLNSTSTSSVVRLDDINPQPGMVDVVVLPKVSGKDFTHGQSLIKGRYSRIDKDDCMCVSFSGFLDNINIDRYIVGLHQNGKEIQIRSRRSEGVECFCEDWIWQEGTLYAAEVMAFDVVNRTCVGRKEFIVDTSPPEVAVLAVYNFSSQEQFSVSFDFTVTDRGSGLAEIRYRICPVYIQECVTEYMTFPLLDPVEEPCCSKKAIWQSSGKDNLIEGQMYRVHLTAVDIATRVTEIISSQTFTYDSSPPEFGSVTLAGYSSDNFSSSTSALRLFLVLAKDLESGINSSQVCVGTFYQRDSIMDCTKLEDLISCSDSQVTEEDNLCFSVVSKGVESPLIEAIYAFYETINGAGLDRVFSSNPISIDCTPPIVKHGAISLLHADRPQNSICAKLPPSTFLKSEAPEFQLTFQFSLIQDPESGIKDYHFKLALVSSKSNQHMETTDRWHIIDREVPTIHLNSFEDLQHHATYKVVLRVINQAGLETITDSLHFMWDTTSPEWHQPPSSLLTKSAANDGLHYVNAGDEIHFSWSSNAQNPVYFSVAICILDGSANFDEGIAEICELPLFVGNSTTFTLDGDKVIPGKGSYIQVCMLDASCKSACKSSNIVIVQPLMPVRVQGITVASITVKEIFWTASSNENQNWTVELKWKLVTTYVQSCAICLLGRSGAEDTCEQSKLDHGRIGIGSHSIILENANIASHSIIVRVTTYSGRVYSYSSASGDILLDLTGPVGKFELFRMDRPCLEHDNCKQSSFDVAHHPDGVLIQSSLTSLQARVDVSDHETGVLESVFAVVKCTKGREVERISSFDPVPPDGILSMTNLDLNSAEAYCFIVESKNGQGLVSRFTSAQIQTRSLLPSIGRLWDGQGSNDIDWINTSSTASCSWHKPATIDVQDLAHYEVRLLRGEKLEVNQCKEQALDLNTTLAFQRVDPNNTAHTLRALSLSSGEHYFCAVSACSWAGKCTTSVSNGFKVDSSLPFIGCLHMMGADVQTEESFEYQYVSRKSIMSFYWISPLQKTHLSEARRACLSRNIDTDINTSLAQKDDEAPVVKFQIFYSFLNVTSGNMNWTFSSINSINSSFLMSSPRYNWTFLSEMAHFSSSVNHTITLQLQEEHHLQANQIYTVMITAIKASGAYSMSNFFSFVYDESFPEVGNISDIPIFEMSHVYTNNSSTENTSGTLSVNDDLDWISRPAKQLKIVWNNFFDPESGIGKYLVCMGTAPSLCDVSELVDVGLSQLYVSSPTWRQSNSSSDRLYATVTVCNFAIPPLCRNSSSDGVGMDTTPPLMMETYDGYEEGVDWQQQGFVNSVFGNWKAHDDISGILEYEWSYGGTNINISQFFSAGSSRIMGKLDLAMVEYAHKIFVCARAVNEAGLRSAILCSDGVLKGKNEISVTSEAKEAFGFGIDRLYKSQSDESVVTNATVYVSINFPPASVSKPIKLLAGPVMTSEYTNSSDLENPSSQNLRAAPNMKVGNYSFVLKVANSSADEGFAFKSPIKLSLFFDISKISSDTSLNDRVVQLIDVPCLLLRNVSSGQWTNAADTCSTEMLTRAGIDERWHFNPQTSIFNVYICHLTQFAIAFQKAPVAIIGKVPKVVYPDNSAILNGSASQDPDGKIMKYRWSFIGPSHAQAVLETPYSSLSNLTNLVPGSYSIELIVEDIEFSTATAAIEVIVVGEAKKLKVHGQPPSCSSAGEYLSVPPVASVHDEADNLVETPYDLRLSATLLHEEPSLPEDATVRTRIAASSDWKQGRTPSNGYVVFSDLHIFTAGRYSLEFSASSLVSASSHVFVIVPGPAQDLQVAGLESRCFFQEQVLSPKLVIIVRDSFGNNARVSQFEVSARINESQTHITTITGSGHENFRISSDLFFCGRIMFVLAGTTSFGCNSNQTERQVKLEFISEPLCVVSRCGPGEARTCSANDGGMCSACPSGKWVSGNMTSCLSCPSGSTSLNGSQKMTDCQCSKGFSGNNGGPCVACDAGTYKSTVGDKACPPCLADSTSASGATHCYCNAGFTGTNGTCVACTAGTYKNTTGSALCETCPPNSNSSAGNDDIINCECNAGFFGPNGRPCFACVVGTFKDVLGSSMCAECPVSTTSPVGSTSTLDCVCSKGFTGEKGGPCEACVAGTFKEIIGGSMCAHCPAGKYLTETGATSSSKCSSCLPGSYSSAASATCTKCSIYSDSPASSDAVIACICNVGFSGHDGGNCSMCVAGTYKSERGNASCTRCPAGKSSALASVNKNDCSLNSSSSTTAAPTSSSSTTPAPTSSSSKTAAPTSSSSTTPAPTSSSSTTAAPTSSSSTTPASTPTTSM